MRLILATAWPLLLGMLLIMMGHGLQSTLLGLRASAEGFSVTATGFIMSLYFIGFLIGSVYVPKLIGGVGHIRVFTAMASLASITILMHGVFVEEWLWGLIRIITGFTFAGLYIVTESWLNDATTNETRGKIFSSYLMIIHLGLFSGQYFIGLTSIENLNLFVLVSVLVSLAVTPIALSRRPAPSFDYVEPFPLKRLLTISPLGVIGIFASGVTGATFFVIGAVATAEMGFSATQSATFIAAYVLGSAFIPPATGWLSDKIGRRRVIIGSTILATIFVSGGFFLQKEMLYGVAFLSGGFIVSLYGLCIAYMNDHLEPQQFVSASAAMILVNAAGAVFGPVISTFLMDMFGPQSFFAFLAGVLLSVTIFALYRSNVTQAIPIEEQADFVPVHQNTAATVIQIAEDDEEENEKDVDKFEYAKG
ncbi:MAG: MFS transporter [Pseudomonadota bacterium]